MKRIIEIGETFGNIKVLSILQNRPRKYNVQCLRCGKIFTLTPSIIIHKNSGCLDCKRKDARQEKIKWYEKMYNGKIFGTLKVLGFDTTKSKFPHAKCLCLKCNGISSIRYISLTSGSVKTCYNCAKENLKKGHQRMSDLSKDGTSLTAATRPKCMKNSNNTSGYTGVSQLKSGKYRANIKFKYKQYHLGVYDDPKDASIAYQEAKKKLYNGFIEWYQENYPDLWEKYKDSIKKRQEM